MESKNLKYECKFYKKCNDFQILLTRYSWTVDVCKTPQGYVKGCGEKLPPGAKKANNTSCLPEGRPLYEDIVKTGTKHQRTDI